MKDMLRSSLPLARILGVEVRAHISLVLLLFLAVGYSIATSSNAARGIGLWLALCFAVLVREFARTLTALQAGLPLRGILLLPVGGVFALAARPDGRTPEGGRAIALSGPAANLLVGLLLFGMITALVPELSLLHQPWIGTHHILRSVVWMQLLLGIVGMLPPKLLPTRSIGEAAGRPETRKTPRVFTDVGGLAGILLLLVGFAFVSLWIVVLGSALLLTAQLRLQRPAGGIGGQEMRVKDAMLQDFVLLSSSDTFKGALQRVTQSLQDTFPVVRGNVLVGSISRGVLARNLRFGGDGYLQGAMNRVTEIAEPDEIVGKVLQRANGPDAAEVLPVLQHGVVVGILTPQGAARAAQGRRLTEVLAARESEQ